MYVACDGNKNAVAIEHADRNKVYYCPACGERLIQKRGNIKAHHFAHTVNVDCCMAKPMTEWHLDWQRRFPDANREVVFRNEANEVRRADVSVGDLVVEFQHSKIAITEITERTAFYREYGKQIWWVFDRSDECTSELLETTYVPHNPVDILRVTGRYIEPNPEFNEATIHSKNDIAVLDYGGFCIVLGNWIYNDMMNRWNRAASAYIVSKQFFANMVLDPAVHADPNTFDVDRYMTEKWSMLDGVADSISNALGEEPAKKYFDMPGTYVLCIDAKKESNPYRFPYLFHYTPKIINQDLWHDHIKFADKYHSYLRAQILQIETENKPECIQDFVPDSMRIMRVTPAIITLYILIDIREAD